MTDVTQIPPPIASTLSTLLKKLKAKFVIGFVPVTLAVLTLCFGAVGWGRKLFDGSLHSIVLITLNSLADFSPSVKTFDQGNDLTDLAALCGILALYSSAAVIAANVLREWWRKLVARLSRAHIIVVGDTPLSERADKVWQRRDRHALRIVPTTADRPAWTSRYVRHGLDATLVEAFALAKAGHVFLDLGEDGRTLALAYRLLSKIAAIGSHANPKGIDREWIVVGRDIDMADHFITKVRDLRSKEGATVTLPRLHFLDPERLEARHFVADEPLFLGAERQGARRIHVLIVGFSPIAWHLAEMTYLSGLTVALEAPRVTILTPQADVQRRRFFSGRADLSTAVDIAFLEFDALDDFQTGETVAGQLLRERDQAAPVTAIFSVLEDTDRNIAIAMRIDAIQRKTTRLGCPIFTRDEDADNEAFLSAGGRFDQIIGGLSTFGLADGFLDSEICDTATRDVLPRALHAHYIAKLPPSSSGTAAWDDLSETLRRANRNAAAHWSAKMDVLGFDVGNLPSGVLPRLSDADWRRLLAAADAPPDSPDGAAILQVAHCEHDRWMIERRLDGWTYGPIHDPLRQTHPLLVPWDAFVRDHPDAIDKNKDQIRALLDCLHDAGDPNVVLTQKRDANPPGTT